ncbi:MAG: ATP-dependent helicase UvrD/PcrA, partial [Actinomycetota bacterium]|nr:ATP-dependent helicase UvrD/PcrA [Actinomycetota bacterium]
MGTDVPPQGYASGCGSGCDSGCDSGYDDRLLDGLNDAQREAVVSDAAPLCILAGAGSGKTRVLTRRIAWRVSRGSALAAHVLALTFTRRAAAELGGRLSQLGVREQVAAGTFHSVAYGQLRRWWADNDERPPAVLDSKVGVLAKLMPGLLPRRGERGSAEPADVAAEIEWAKARMIGPADYEAAAAGAGRRPSLPAGAVAALYERYEDEKRRRHRVDFDDLLLLCAAALEDDRRFGAAQRWRFRHLFVDEFQDVNPLQFRLLEAWRDGRPDLCVVGDPNQAIYAWNGADPGYLTGFRQRFPAAAVVRLDDNYRSSPQVLAVANAVLDSSVAAPTPMAALTPMAAPTPTQSPVSVSVSSAAGGSPATGRGMRAHQPGGPAPTVASYATDGEEAAGIAAALRLRVGEVGWAQMAVLTRTHAQLVLFERALAAAGVPFRLRGGGGFLERAEIRGALAEIGRRPADTLLAAALPDLRELAEEDVAAPAGTATERRSHLESLHRLAREHLATDPSATCSAFLGGLRATLRGDDPDPGHEGVVLATFHAAKGLEWEVVFLAGLEQGLLPIGHAETPEARAEEQRLLYVAV